VSLFIEWGENQSSLCGPRESLEEEVEEKEDEETRKRHIAYLFMRG
jgi:hypothetical protein